MSIIFTVPQGHSVVITRFGKYSRTANQGLRFKLPFIEKIHKIGDWGNQANKHGFQIELSEQNIDTSPRECHTKDNVPVTVDASIYWRILNVSKAVFEVDCLPKSIIDTCLNSLRGQIGKLSLDEVLQSRRELNDKIAVELKDVGSKWGIQINRVELKELLTSDETADAMRQEMVAERLKRSKILEADGEAQSKLKVAEADAKVIELKARAEAEAIKLKAGAEAEYLEKLSVILGKEEVGKILVTEKVLESYKAISGNAANKVFLPSNISTLISDQISTNN